jgi:2-polyprenyl-6-methoxyphenol hydroxylase-like FAD-dependent oxidoreductase
MAGWSIAIAGAGIGGLTLAAALRRRGTPATVLERAGALAPVGAGITVQPNAMVALGRLGLAERVADAGQAITEAAIVDPTGRPLGAPVDASALAAALGAPIIAIHRARLHAILLDAAGGARTGAEVVSVDERGRHVIAVLAGGGSHQADVLVGADGVRSAVRAHLVGDGEPVYAGYASWRGVAPAGAASVGARTTETWGRGQRFGVVPLGGGETYWFATANAAAGGRDGDVAAELAARFAGWHDPIPALLAATPAERIVRTDIADRPVITRWHRGRIVLLGDAAHPMTPNVGQGGCQAIEDAVVLDEALAAHDDLEAALAAYERRRVMRANGIVTAARRLGAVAQWQSPAACWLRGLALRLTPAAAARRQMKAMMTFPAT